LNLKVKVNTKEKGNVKGRDYEEEYGRCLVNLLVKMPPFLYISFSTNCLNFLAGRKNSHNGRVR
jgi:hypothetical protein